MSLNYQAFVNTQPCSINIYIYTYLWKKNIYIYIHIYEKIYILHNTCRYVYVVHTPPHLMLLHFPQTSGKPKSRWELRYFSVCWTHGVAKKTNAIHLSLAKAEVRWKEGVFLPMILLMDKILHQLRLVVYPIIYKVLYIPGGCLGFRPSTVCVGI